MFAYSTAAEIFGRRAKENASNIVGWARWDEEPWEHTMRRVRQKVDRAVCIHPIEDWSAQLLRLHFRLICRFARQTNGWPSRVSRWCPSDTNPFAAISRGRPRVRWDDRLRNYYDAHFQKSWPEAKSSEGFSVHEDAFVRFSLWQEH